MSKGKKRMLRILEVTTRSRIDDADCDHLNLCARSDLRSYYLVGESASVERTDESVEMTSSYVPYYGDWDDSLIYDESCLGQREFLTTQDKFRIHDSDPKGWFELDISVSELTWKFRIQKQDHIIQAKGHRIEDIQAHLQKEYSRWHPMESCELEWMTFHLEA
jgi:hypothetical protein